MFILQGLEKFSNAVSLQFIPTLVGDVWGGGDFFPEDKFLPLPIRNFLHRNFGLSSAKTLEGGVVHQGCGDQFTALVRKVSVEAQNRFAQVILKLLSFG